MLRLFKRMWRAEEERGKAGNGFQGEGIRKHRR